MRHTFLSLILSAVALFAQAQSPNDIIKRATESFNPDKGFALKFAATFSVNKEEHQGTLYVKGDKYRVETPSVVIFSDGTARYSYILENNEVVVEPLTSQSSYIPASPANLLRYQSTEKIVSLGKQLLHGTSYDAYSAERLHAKLYLSSGTLKAVEISDKGNIFVFKVVGLLPSATLPENLFTFQKSAYPNAEIIDFR